MFWHSLQKSSPTAVSALLRSSAFGDAQSIPRVDRAFDSILRAECWRSCAPKSIGAGRGGAVGGSDYLCVSLRYRRCSDIADSAIPAGTAIPVTGRYCDIKQEPVLYVTPLGITGAGSYTPRS
eukprot:gene5066-biopygen9167